jgi:penicillin-binding protein 1C
VLASLAARGAIEQTALRTASAQPMPRRAGTLPRQAMHLAGRLAPQAAQGTVATLIDRPLQQRAEAIATSALRLWEGGVNIAIVVVRNADGAVVGYVGSGAADRPERNGFVDLARAVRSPGSALKPFVYTMAFESLIAHPDTVVADQAIDIAGYRPANADGTYSGDMTMRQALILSRNTVPVMLLDRIGVEPFLTRFRTVGAPLRLGASDNQAGLAVALGGAGVTLEQLTWLYSAFANEGELKRLRWTAGERPETLGNLFSAAAANAVADILADVPPPAGDARLASLDGSRRVGFKTGTSYGFRDAWSVGFDKLHTVGVWIGRPDGAPHLGAYGVSAAAPVMMQVFDALPVPAAGAASGRKPLGALASPRALPPRLARFGPAAATDPGEALAIAFPKPGARIAVARMADGAGLLPLKVAGGRPPFRWTVLGREGAPRGERETFAELAERGAIDITVTDADGKLAKSSIWFE